MSVVQGKPTTGLQTLLSMKSAKRGKLLEYPVKACLSNGVQSTMLASSFGKIRCGHLIVQYILCHHLVGANLEQVACIQIAPTVHIFTPHMRSVLDRKSTVNTKYGGWGTCAGSFCQLI